MSNVSYFITTPVSFTNTALSIVANIDTVGNIASNKGCAFSKNSSTAKWTIDANLANSYRITYQRLPPNNYQGLMVFTDLSNLIYYDLEGTNVRVVRSNPAPNQFSDVRSAIATIPSGANVLNPFTVWVQPGTYTETNFQPIVIPSGVYITGFGMNETILVDHNFVVNAVPTGTAQSAFGINKATFRRTNQSDGNTFLSVSSNNTYGLILDSKFENWKSLFNMTSSANATTLRVGGISTSEFSTSYPNLICNLAYSANNTGSNFEINRSNFVLDTDSTPFVISGPQTNFCLGGFGIRDCSFEGTSFGNVDFVNATSFTKMVMKNLDIKNYANILTISGIGLNIPSNFAQLVFSDVIAPDATRLIQDTPNFSVSYNYPINQSVNVVPSIMGNKTDVNKIFLSNANSFITTPFLDYAKNYPARSIFYVEDFTSPIYPFSDNRPWDVVRAGSANITNSVPTLSQDAIVNGFITLRAPSSNDGVCLMPNTNGLTALGVDFSVVQYAHLTTGVTPFDAIGKGNSTFVVGFGDSNLVTNVNVYGAGANSNGLFFGYSPSTSTFGENFVCVSKSFGNLTIVDSNVAVSNSIYYNLTIDNQSTGGTTRIANFFINNERVAQINSNITIAKVIPFTKLISVNGDTAWSVDYINYSARLNRFFA